MTTMTNASMTEPGAPSRAPADQEALLHRILAAVEKDRRRGGLEAIVALILSLATLASTWCGYQARQWSGAQAANQAASDTAERQAAESTIVGLQIRTQDGLVLLEYWRAVRERDEMTARTIYLHMRPQLRDAVDAAVKDGIETDPGVRGPLQRPEYALPEEQTAIADRDQAASHQALATSAGKTAGSYVLLTLMFASVLFFGGIGGTFSDRRIRTGLASVALVLFAVTLLMLAALPTYHG
ncbi:MAG: hypothetical protein IT436_00485 [Phycisphaerales bacterium]|nr:hypothetical protein [Phycisphaerales bacterium]